MSTPISPTIISAVRLAIPGTVSSLVAVPSRTLLFREHIDWDIVRWFVAGAVPGALLGAWLFTHTEANWLQLLIAVFLAYTANRGLPFVPTRELKVDIANGADLTVGSDVRAHRHAAGRNGSCGRALHARVDIPVQHVVHRRRASGRQVAPEAGQEHEQGRGIAGHVHGADGRQQKQRLDLRLGQLDVVAEQLGEARGTTLRGQLEGGFVFGLGQAVMEELRLDDGRVTTTNLGDYKIPTIADAPPLRLILVTDAPGPGPFGAKSAGELANPAVGAAIANAIDAAVGVRVMSLPITAEKIRSLLRTKELRAADPE